MRWATWSARPGCGRSRSGPTSVSRSCSPPTGAVWNEWLIRAPGAEGPALRTLDDLAPWSCTVDEAARAFPPARPLEGTAPTRWGLAFTAPDEEGVRRKVVAEFTWGLLQRLTVR
ncbi:hypothetical protein RKD19_005647 [Streptomyces canus]